MRFVRVNMLFVNRCFLGRIMFFFVYVIIGFGMLDVLYWKLIFEFGEVIKVFGEIVICGVIIKY